MSKFVVVLSTRGRGGIRAVVDRLWLDGLGEKTGRRIIWTHVEGGLIRRLYVAACAYLQFLCFLFAGRVSLVHAHVAMKGSFWRKAIFARIAKFFRVPVIFHLHGSEMKAFYERQPSVLKKAISRQLQSVDAVVVLSNAWRDFVISIAPASSVHVVPNYVAVPDSSAEKKDSSTFNVLFLGLLGDRKGIFDLIEAIGKVASSRKGVKLFVGGNGEIDRVRSEVNRLGLDGCVELLGWISGSQKDSLLAKADVFVLPSYNEGLPISILEAMSWGVPVISTTVGGIPELVREGCDGFLISPGDVSSLATRLEMLFDDRELRMKMGRFARQRVVDDYSCEKILPRLASLYSGLISKNYS